ncbi:MAG: hypothetical protein K0R27_277 [Xanthobacteraceae bacterium]|nr:hypothetical protein [Xanthobacteraceae bacterium]
MAGLRAAVVVALLGFGASLPAHSQYSPMPNPNPPVVLPYRNAPAVLPYGGQPPAAGGGRVQYDPPDPAEGNPPRQPNPSLGTAKVYDASCFNIRTNGGFLSKTIKELVVSQEAQLLGAAICTYYAGDWQTCRQTTKYGADVGNALIRHQGSDYWGMIKPRPGYDVCRIAWDEKDWSVTSDATFTARIAFDANLRAYVLHYYVSMKTGDRRGHFVDTKVILEQVPIGTRRMHGCWPHMYVGWSCKGTNCSQVAPKARASIGNYNGAPLCISHR